MKFFNFFGKAKNGIMNGGEHRTGCARVARGKNHVENDQNCAWKIFFFHHMFYEKKN